MIRVAGRSRGSQTTLPSHFQASLIVHGGAWNIPHEALEECRSGCRSALEVGWEILKRGGEALDAVEASVAVLEDNPVFDAGTGSHLNRDGNVQLDAIIMDGKTLRAGAVAAVERIRNPIRLARRLMTHSEHILLVGAGAEQFAVEQGMELCDPADLIVEREKVLWQRVHRSRSGPQPGQNGEAWGSPDDDVPTILTPPSPNEANGTVGAVAMDQRGNLVAGTSTGGTFDKWPGRVGDSPLIGCGCYADIEGGGVSCTGWGEAIMKIVLAKTAVEMLRSGLQQTSTGSGETAEFPRRAAEECVQLLAKRVQGTGGLILLDRKGQPGFAFNTPRMAFGYVARDGAFVVTA